MAEVRNINEHRTLRPGEDTLLQCKAGGGEYTPIDGQDKKPCMLCGMDKKEHQTVHLRPRCPHCGGDGTKLAAIPMRLGPIDGFQIFATCCGHTVHYGVLGIAQQQSPVLAPDGGPLIMGGR
jgi:hypothetical protein